MKIISVQQGSDDWLKIRSAHDTASEAPAANGKSKYTTRTELMHQKHTGISQDVDGAKQALFDRGHAAESAARSIAEEIIGLELYPITASLHVDGVDLLASLDGITLDEEIIWEHKLYSAKLAEDVNAGTLDPHYTIQLDQQLLVSQAKRCLFMTSDGTKENMACCWYEPSNEKFDALVAGWKQFRSDLAAYTPREITEKPKAAAILSLPALAIQIRGEVTLSNLPAFKEAASTFIANINTDLKTDEDFAQAEETVKFCKAAEDDLDAAKKAAIGQTASIDELMRTIDHIQAQLRDKRLTLDKLVKSEKEAIKQRILMDAAAAFSQHVMALDVEVAPLRLDVTKPDFAGAMKNKRTMSSLHDAVDTELARAKMEADAVALDIRRKLAWFNTESVDRTLFPDLQAIIQKPFDDFCLLVQSRVAQREKEQAEKFEAERQRIQQEEQAKAEAKVKADQQAKADAERIEREKAEAAAKAQRVLDELEEETLRQQEAKPASPAPAQEPAKPAPVATQSPVKLAEATTSAPAKRPSDSEIIGALAMRFSVSEQTVLSWLADFSKQQEAA